jgi:DNA-binding CsgD family transcriptional regulator
MDPATRLPTGEVVDNGLPPAATRRMTEIEMRGEDFNTFDALAASGHGAATLSAATNGELDCSLRHRELRRPNGFGDELRAVLAGDGAAWGALTLLRAADRRHFTPDDAVLVASVSRYLAEGVRRALLLCAATSDRRDDPEESVGFALVEGDNSIAMANPAAEMWLAELRENGPEDLLPAAVVAVATRARSIAHVREAGSAVARVRGSTLGEGADTPTAVMLEPARADELAPLIAAAYGLSERERVVTQMVAQGLATAAIARRLHLSPWTVQDHLKAIFAKLDVSSRGELVARMFFDHYAPRLMDEAPVGADGWFAPSPAPGPGPARGTGAAG